MEVTRTKKAKINVVITLIAQICQILLGFFVRKLFIEYLGVTYLGYNSVFTNILQMLNLADMGVGVAVTSYLYKPLAEQDKNRISALMYLYKKIYQVLGIIVLIIGLVLSLFLKFFIPDATCGIWYLRLLFYINLIGTLSTYFLAYKRNLIIADQKSYLTNIVDTGIFMGITILQIFSILLFPSYVIYLSLNIVKNIASNVIVSIKVNKSYEYINNVPEDKLVQEYKPKITQYVKDVFVSGIGAVVYYSTDNIILSVIKGSLLTGYLSNYTLITTRLNTVVTQVLSSIQATFANFISTTENKENKMKMIDNYFCVNFCIGNFCMICFSLLVQSFVKLLFGEEMLLPFSTALLLSINLLLTFLIQLPSQVFVIYKLFRYDRPIIIISALLNIVVSFLLAYKIGINGVLIGTFFTSIIYLFSRFYVIAKMVHQVSYLYYIKKLAIYGSVSFLTFLICFISTKDYGDYGWISFFVKAIFVVGISIVTTAFFLSFLDEFQFLKNKLLPYRIKKYITKISLGILGLIFIFTSVCIGRFY